MIFTIDASLLPLIQYVHISLWFTRTVVTEGNGTALQVYSANKTTGWTTFTQHDVRIQRKWKNTRTTLAAPPDASHSHALGRRNTLKQNKKKVQL